MLHIATSTRIVEPASELRIGTEICESSLSKDVVMTNELTAYERTNSVVTKFVEIEDIFSGIEPKNEIDSEEFKFTM